MYLWPRCHAHFAPLRVADTYDNVIQASMSTPFLARDAILQAWGADCLEESMKYLIIGK